MDPFDEPPSELCDAAEDAPLTVSVGATFDRWPAITWPLLNLEIGASHVTIAARRGFSALVCRFVGLTYVPGLEHEKVLWIVRRTDATIVNLRSLSVDVRRASDGAVLRIDSPKRRDIHDIALALGLTEFAAERRAAPHDDVPADRTDNKERPVD